MIQCGSKTLKIDGKDLVCKICGHKIEDYLENFREMHSDKEWNDFIRAVEKE